MKGTAIKKLRSNDGASLMVALLFFVVCAVVGSIVLSAATVSSGRMTGIKKNSRDYYTLTSAAKVFQTNLTPGELLIYRDAVGAVIARDDTAKVDDSVSQDNQFLAQRDLMAIDVFSTNSSVTKTFFISVQENSDISRVKAIATMQNDYNLEISFTVDDEDNTGNNEVKLVFKAKQNVVTEDDIAQTTIVWGSPGFYVGGRLK